MTGVAQRLAAEEIGVEMPRGVLTTANTTQLSTPKAAPTRYGFQRPATLLPTFKSGCGPFCFILLSYPSHSRQRCLFLEQFCPSLKVLSRGWFLREARCLYQLATIVPRSSALAGLCLS